MNPETNRTNFTELEAQTESMEAQIEEKGSALVAQSFPSGEEAPWRQAQGQVAALLDQLIDNIGGFVSEFFVVFQRPIVLLLILLGAGVSVKLALAVLDAVDEMPLLATLFEAIGFVYTLWFVYQHLWFAESRKELLGNLQSALDRVLGKSSPTA